MGEYIIPDAGFGEVSQAIYHVRQQGLWTEAMVWDWGHPEGIQFTDPTRTDEQCAALYLGFVAQEGWSAPLPDAVRTHLQHLRDYLAKDPATITNAESVHAIKDLIRAVHNLNRRFETEG